MTTEPMLYIAVNGECQRESLLHLFSRH